MKQVKLIMGMPITIEIIDEDVSVTDFDAIFTFFRHVDEQFSTYKETSEISMLNNKKIQKNRVSETMKYILNLSEMTKDETDGYFSIERNGYIDPSGMVKGWAIQEGATLLKKKGFKNFYIDAGGDIQTVGKNIERLWEVGIRNPFDRNAHVQVLAVTDKAVATSGTAIRGQHIYNPHVDTPLTDIISMTVIGDNILDADRFATAAFAMGRKGIYFLEEREGFEGYMIDKDGIATETTGFFRYVKA